MLRIAPVALEVKDVLHLLYSMRDTTRTCRTFSYTKMQRRRNGFNIAGANNVWE